MRNDRRNGSRNVVQRRAVVPVVVVVSFVLTLTSVWVGMANLIDDRTDLTPAGEWLLVQGTASLAGTLVAALVGVLTTRLHCEVWPEHPIEE